MINYDMPWNPTRLEQRLGRIHRIGQRDDCYAFNFVATEGEDGDAIVEGRILERLLEKLETMKASLAGRVFDVIGEVLSPQRREPAGNAPRGGRRSAPARRLPRPDRPHRPRQAHANTSRPPASPWPAPTWISPASRSGTWKSKNAG